MLHQCINIYNVMFTIYFIAIASNSNPSPSEDNTSGTDLSIIPTEDEKQTDTTDWVPAKHKKLQHMKEFHEEYQCVFGKKASIHTIMKNRITHMNPPCLIQCVEKKCKVPHQITMLSLNTLWMHKEEK